ncbi:uncharacterized protein LOC132066752 isoform X1 [Lycium ferocissimum]|uniref:uncharacterized protein LOC132066752 isoform X1 n=1 Tax=Lycium ferocissimum TaxID=112874 RepID=UPI00281514FC|nr:uncharacterized protein LOC132066752 isoform X1 [Lycium ferocissimum]
MEDEGEKRKSEDNNDVFSEAAKKKQKEEMKTEEVAEEEVEEFFAILRRIQVAVKYFSKDVDGASGSGGRKMTVDIDRKCSDEIVGDNEEKKEKDDDQENKGFDEKDDDQENKGFDLNMDPCDPHDQNSSGEDSSTCKMLLKASIGLNCCN